MSFVPELFTIVCMVIVTIIVLVLCIEYLRDHDWKARCEYLESTLREAARLVEDEKLGNRRAHVWLRDAQVKVDSKDYARFMHNAD